MACRINKKREWTGRILLEASCFDESIFLTLTYDDSNLPTDGSVQKRDLQLFFKRLRRYGHHFRYFAVGEYGDKTFRPHYHACLFGVSQCITPDIERAWSLGFIQVGELTKDSASYVAGYTTKKMTSPNDNRLQGRKPEFTLSSKASPGGIGASAIDQLSEFLLNRSHFVALHGTIPRILQHGGKGIPIGRYLLKKLSEKTALPLDECKKALVHEAVKFADCGFDLVEYDTYMKKQAKEHDLRLNKRHNFNSKRTL